MTLHPRGWVGGVPPVRREESPGEALAEYLGLIAGTRPRPPAWRNSIALALAARGAARRVYSPYPLTNPREEEAARRATVATTRAIEADEVVAEARFIEGCVGFAAELATAPPGLAARLADATRGGRESVAAAIAAILRETRARLAAVSPAEGVLSAGTASVVPTSAASTSALDAFCELARARAGAAAAGPPHLPSGFALSGLVSALDVLASSWMRTSLLDAAGTRARLDALALAVAAAVSNVLPQSAVSSTRRVFYRALGDGEGALNTPSGSFHAYATAVLMDAYGELAGFEALPGARRAVAPPSACPLPRGVVRPTAADVAMWLGRSYDATYESERRRRALTSGGLRDAYNAAIPLGQTDATLSSYLLIGRTHSSVVNALWEPRWPLDAAVARRVVQGFDAVLAADVPTEPRPLRVVLSALVVVGDLTEAEAAAALVTRVELRNGGFAMPGDGLSLVEVNPVCQEHLLVVDNAVYGPMPALEAVGLFMALSGTGPFAARASTAAPSDTLAAMRLDINELLDFAPRGTDDAWPQEGTA